MRKLDNGTALRAEEEEDDEDEDDLEDEDEDGSVADEVMRDDRDGVHGTPIGVREAWWPAA
jgi:hypothetical protein